MQRGDDDDVSKVVQTVTKRRIVQREGVLGVGGERDDTLGHLVLAAVTNVPRRHLVDERQRRWLFSTRELRLHCEYDRRFVRLCVRCSLFLQYVVVTVCLKAGLVTNSWTVPTHCAIWGSIVMWFLFVIVYR